MDGFRLLPGYLDAAAQADLLTAMRDVLAEAPPYQPEMPRTGQKMRVRMSNAGPLGWYTDRAGGYRYIAQHPLTGRPWPAIPAALLVLWQSLTGYAAAPECCLINLYDAEARMGLHQDRDEQVFDAPVLSVSLGATAIFRLGGTSRSAPTRSFRLASGDVMLLAGPARLAFHGIDRIQPGSSRLVPDDLIPGGGRINLTLRRVTPPETVLPAAAVIPV